jgi:hypothetical protein
MYIYYVTVLYIIISNHIIISKLAQSIMISNYLIITYRIVNTHKLVPGMQLFT